MVPFTLAAIPEIAVKAGFVRIDSVAAGLAGEDEAGDDEAGDEGE
jgi:16S rRNA processing protein RimM